MNKQFLTFTLDGSQYAVEVYSVQEVLEYTQITKIPCAASYMEGIINSRGQGVSVVNLRKKFGIEDVNPGKLTRIIVLEIVTEAGEKSVFGAIADAVHEVITLEEESIEPSPKFGNSIAARFINGIGKRNGEFIILLNINAIFSTDEIINLEKVAAEAVNGGK